VAGWMKTPLGTEVDISTGHIVLDGFPALHERGTAPPPPLLGPCLLWPNGWMDQDGTWIEMGLGPGHIVLDGEPAPLPIFRPFLLSPNEVWGIPANFNGFCVVAALLQGTLVVGVSQTLRCWTEGVTFIRQGSHHVGDWPTF